MGPRSRTGRAFLSSLILWLVAVRVLGHLRARHRWAGWAGVGLVSAFLPAAVIATVGFYARFRVDLPPSAVSFLIRNPDYGWVLILETIGWLGEGRGGSDLCPKMCP